jgi:hypothetical protein
VVLPVLRVQLAPLVLKVIVVLLALLDPKEFKAQLD